MAAAVSLGGAIPVTSSQASRKEWRAVADHSFRNNGAEEDDRVKLGQSAERTIYEVQEGTGPLDVDFCSITIEDGHELSDDILQQKLQEITRQREELQQMEIELRARVLTRSGILEVQNSFEVQLKEHRDINKNLKDQLLERERYVFELEMKLGEKDRELRALKINTEAAWAKEDILREQNKELSTFRRERDNSEAERAQLMNQIHDLQEHVQEKENQFLALQEQHRVTQDTIVFKDEQLREAQAWVARVQEMDALQSSTNQSLQAELRERTEHFNQYWIGLQRQFVEMERHHLQAIQQLQLELTEARGRTGTYKDGSNSVDSSSYNGNHINAKNGDNSNIHLGFTSDGGVDNTSSYVSTSNPSTMTEHISNVPIMPSSIVGINAFIPPGQMTSMLPYVMNQQGVPQSVASTNSPILQSHMGIFQPMPVVPPQQHWQNQQSLLDISKMPSQSNYTSSLTEQDLLRSDENHISNLSGETKTIHSSHLDNQIDQQQMSDSSGNQSSGEVQVLELNDSQYPVAQPQGYEGASRHEDSTSQFDLPDKKQEPTAENQLQEQELESAQEWPCSSTTLSTSQSCSSINFNSTTESSMSSAVASSIPVSASGKQLVEPNLLDERSLLACIVRAIPAGSDGRIRISTTLPNRLGKMLAPLHWHHYKKMYGKLDDFVARHPELFVIEGDLIHLREGAQQIISATAAVAKVAAATAAASSPYTSLLPSVAVTPVAQISRQKKAQLMGLKPSNNIHITDSSAVTDSGDSNGNCTQILTRQDQQLNGVRLNTIQGPADVTISSKLKNFQKANGSPSEIKSGHSSVGLVGNAANLARGGLNPLQNKGLVNGRHNFGGKQQARYFFIYINICYCV
ncbi:hypothetical protein Cni_G26927 [Canna indica]|uniref:DUF7725 domain-containing protein n=1 Tax=Canna indica TaxID=4628 RepID=A0AAQ3QNU0_9LILI|nr:hypothetical protein Cni_G26927 [Canna indica]